MHVNFTNILNDGQLHLKTIVERILMVVYILCIKGPHLADYCTSRYSTSAAMAVRLTSTFLIIYACI